MVPATWQFEPTMSLNVTTGIERSIHYITETCGRYRKGPSILMALLYNLRLTNVWLKQRYLASKITLKLISPPFRCTSGLLQWYLNPKVVSKVENCDAKMCRQLIL